MTLWVVRAGRDGEYEELALNEGAVAVSFGLRKNVADFADRDALRVETGKRTSADQLWRFYKELQTGDMVVLPRKRPKVVAVGRVSGDYIFRPDFVGTAQHTRSVDWLATDIPRSNFDQDLLDSMGSKWTVSQPTADNAEARIESVVNAYLGGTEPSVATDVTDDSALESNLYEQIQDRIVTLIRQKFPGPALERLVASILEASGYDAQLTRPGPDSGIDIVAGKGDMGFGEPRLCVQVKSTSTPVGRPVYQQLQGAIQSFGADHGLLVSLGDFTSEVRRENERSFFSIRLWGPDELVSRFLETYDSLPPDIRTEIPLVDRKVLVESEA